MLRLGLDVGSTTAKLVAIDEAGKICFLRYRRHNAQIEKIVKTFLSELLEEVGNEEVVLRITGSVGMGLTERYHLPFVQEVVAATKAVQNNYPSVKAMIDIGGEDVKIVFFKNGSAEDLRMNGNCAGGTGSFIDQMAIILGVTVDELNELALRATQIYPIASRCGVFCKTDIQNLVAKNISRENIAASIFHAVAVQTVTTLAHGYDIGTPVLFCGGPLTFIPALRNAFKDYLALDDSDIILPENGELIPAYGTALADSGNEEAEKISNLIDRLGTLPIVEACSTFTLHPIFEDSIAYREWSDRIAKNHIAKAELTKGRQNAYIGIDSGSTTTKIVVINEKGEMLYTYYKNNGGKPVETVAEGLKILQEQCKERGATLYFMGSCSTGYGEDLIKAAFNLHSGIIETIAHYKAAHHLDNEVSFILDIGGQDMKAIFVTNGIIDRIEINEACSSGCGSFIETFAKSLGYTTDGFAKKACGSTQPADLGTRCTVFMNSKVKQVLREGATVADISAGLAYSVVKNCLYKVLKLKDTTVLGKHIVVQGGTMRNDAIVRALELLTGVEVSRCDCPELMGALGCALYAADHQGNAITLDDMLAMTTYTTRLLNCQGCENCCEVQQYNFINGRRYYSGNRCEKYFNNSGAAKTTGENMYEIKNKLLFDRKTDIDDSPMTIGIPRVLNMFEEYPFWHTLFTECGIAVRLSEPSDYACYEQSARMVMSDNICFPAKLVHSHIVNLAKQNVDRIFLPFVVHEQRNTNDQNSFNCPIVTGYSTVVKSVGQSRIPIDSPVISFNDEKLLLKQCEEYLHLLGVSKESVANAFSKAKDEQAGYSRSITEQNRRVLQIAEREGRLSILLAGRPYHADPLIQHKVSNMLSKMGIHVLTEDIVRDMDIDIRDTHFLAQWSYPNRIMRAAKWCTMQGNNVQFVQLTSFGCGPDAFIVDEVRDLLLRHNKAYTLLKLDDINNIGSMKLRIRSLVESLRMANEGCKTHSDKEFVSTPVFDAKYRHRKIIIPFFTSFISPLIPAIMRIAGYDVDCLPMSNEQSAEWGLKYANNEVCYPATLIIGDIIKAFKEGRYNPSGVAVGITQTGGQCRASNYLPMLKKALVDAGYTDTPVISLTFGDGLDNNQPAFRINWFKMLPIILRTVLFSDCINKFYHAAAVREKEQGSADRLRQMFLQVGAGLIEKGKSRELYSYLSLAAAQFNQICLAKQAPKVGVVGEIYLKFNSFAQRNVVDWLIGQGIEVVPPVLTDFFLQTFVNRKAKVASYIKEHCMSDILMEVAYRLVSSEIKKINKICSSFRYFTPFGDIFHEARLAEKVITLNAQFGEGWLLPAEILSYVENGVKSVVCLQPFGCIANHIVSKGVKKKIKMLCPAINLLSLDFDSGVSDVNIKNRLLLFIDKLKENTHGE
ncbi:MAG: 2-hydroxyacyl-CoA dehydratase [Bacteroidaceae bacterium]|nr:2-hydroxyacyl-CoA dehydratase [Bacteroidaceae bacterium]